jgi:Arc/MetJ family transcription regulator
MCMRTNIVIDDALIAEAMGITGLSTKRETVDYALRELVAQERRKGVLELAGKVQFASDPMDLRRRWRTLGG